MVLLGKYPLLWELPLEAMQRRLRKQTAVKQASIMLGRSKVSFEDWQTPAQRDRVLAWLLNLCKCERKCQKLLKISSNIISTFLFGVIKSKINVELDDWRACTLSSAQDRVWNASRQGLLNLGCADRRVLRRFWKVSPRKALNQLHCTQIYWRSRCRRRERKHGRWQRRSDLRSFPHQRWKARFWVNQIASFLDELILLREQVN